MVSVPTLLYSKRCHADEFNCSNSWLIRKLPIVAIANSRQMPYGLNSRAMAKTLVYSDSRIVCLGTKKSLSFIRVFFKTLSDLMTDPLSFIFFSNWRSLHTSCVNLLILSPCQAGFLISRLRFSKNPRAFLQPKQTNATFCLPNYVHNVRISQWIFF